MKNQSMVRAYIVLIGTLALFAFYLIAGAIRFCSGTDAWTDIIISGASGCGEFWINRYQQLIGSLIALLGALITVYFLHRQIGQADRHNEDKRRRSGRAFNATLPLALSSVCDYARQVLDQFSLAVTRPRMTSGFDPKSLGDPLAIPESAVLTLKECIEYADDEPAVLMAELLHQMQLQGSRYRDFFREYPAEFSSLQDIFEQQFLDALDLYALASDLFHYARDGTLPSEPMRLVSAARLCHVPTTQLPNLVERINVVDANRST